jgi:SAM-dependent methyltransferase
MTGMERLKRERRFHDEQAERRARTFAADPNRLRFRDDEYLDHAAWLRTAIERLGSVAGRSVLDWGCGHGMASVVFARQGAQVTACDIAPGYVSEARRRAAANRVTVNGLEADAHQLPFADGSFDAVWGHAILHHLDVPRAAVELRRVLRPDGVAVLSEPWDGNPLLRLVRRWLPHGRDGHTADERALLPADLEILQRTFRSIDVESFSLLPLTPITRYVVIALRP